VVKHRRVKQKVIAEAYELAMLDKNFKATDDCGIVKKIFARKNIILEEEINLSEDTY
jgi:2-C-methyl-D-erythritol 4-phosphate cytidylyltransferase